MFLFSQRQEKKERAERKGNEEKEEKQEKPQEGDANIKQLLSHLNPRFLGGFSASPEHHRAAGDLPRVCACYAVPGGAGKTRLPKGDGEEKKITFMFFTECFTRRIKLFKICVFLKRKTVAQSRLNLFFSAFEEEKENQKETCVLLPVLGTIPSTS